MKSLLTIAARVAAPETTTDSRKMVKPHVKDGTYYSTLELWHEDDAGQETGYLVDIGVRYENGHNVVEFWDFRTEAGLPVDEEEFWKLFDEGLTEDKARDSAGEYGKEHGDDGDYGGYPQD